ncbi:unnamed protein product [Nesidiocoris tenuis]|uniref:Uncharacterized protein n=1 Tax=Nesidiocoris tenuis TaxID=355587 RepID=A0A6H5HT71_9HEMI|nr:unnamed protein product [Nesidiocoris tenuis]
MFFSIDLENILGWVFSSNGGHTYADNPSYFRLDGADPKELICGGPRTRDMAPEERQWHRRWSTKSDSAGDRERVVLGSTSARFFNHQQPDVRRHSSYTATLTRRQIPAGECGIFLGYFELQPRLRDLIPK